MHALLLGARRRKRKGSYRLTDTWCQAITSCVTSGRCRLEGQGTRISQDFKLQSPSQLSPLIWKDDGKGSWIASWTPKSSCLCRCEQVIKAYAPAPTVHWTLIMPSFSRKGWIEPPSSTKVLYLAMNRKWTPSFIPGPCQSRLSRCSLDLSHF